MGRLHRLGGIVVLVVVALAVLAAGCDGDSDSADEAGDVRIRAGAVERFLDRDLNEGATTPVAVTDVDCGRTRTEGETATAACHATVNGIPVALTIERTEHGDLTRVEAVLVVPSLEGFVANQYDTRLGLAVTVDCGAEELLPAEPGSTVACTATDADGAALAPVVTVDDLDGRVTVALT